MKNTIIKRIFSIFLGTIILTTTILAASLPISAVPVYAAGTGKNLQLGTGPFENGATVYYGSKTDAIGWKIIGFDGNGVASGSGNATLISSGAFGFTKFSDSEGKYGNSNLHTAINNILSNRFTDKEKADTVMLDRTLSGKATHIEAYASGNSNYIWGNDLSGQKLWPLSTAEAKTLRTNFLSISEIPCIWWLRSPGENDLRAAGVNRFGYENDSGYDVDYEYGVRPAFNINLSSIILTSAAVGGKSSGTTGADALNSVGAYTGTEWKLTVIDAARDGEGGFTAERTDYNALAPGAELTISYSGAKTGTNEYVSAIITK